MARRTDTRRRVRRSDEHRLEGVDRRIERRMYSLTDAYEEGDYESLVRHADAIADAAEQGLICPTGKDLAGRMGITLFPIPRRISC